MARRLAYSTGSWPYGLLYCLMYASNFGTRKKPGKVKVNNPGRSAPREWFQTSEAAATTQHASQAPQNSDGSCRTGRAKKHDAKRFQTAEKTVHTAGVAATKATRHRSETTAVFIATK